MRRISPLLAIALVLLPGWYAQAEERPTGDWPNLLLVSIDTLRADHLSAYGYPLETSPNVDGIADEGVLFERAYSQIPVTGPSHCTLLTGLLPQTHGAYRNGVRMNDEAVSLAEILQESGYDTAAFVSGWTMRNELTGLGRGFAHYDEDFTDSYSVINSARPANLTVNRALKWLRAREGDGPFFLFLHLFDPHEPYDEMPGFMDLDASDGSEKPRKRPKKIARYDSEIAFADAHMGRILAELRKDGILENTLVTVVADHGEAFGEHGYEGHGRRVHEPGIRVGLVFRYPGLVAAGRRTEQLAGLIDYAPTVLDILGADPLAAHQGISLLPWLRPGEEAETRSRDVYSVAYPGTVGHMPKFVRRIFGRKKPDKPLQMAVLWDDWKYVYRPQKNEGFLYDLEEDPGEKHDLLGRHPEYLMMRARLVDWFEQTREEEGTTTLTAEDIQRLESLGYADAARAASRESD